MLTNEGGYGGGVLCVGARAGALIRGFPATHHARSAVRRRGENHPNR